jgi:arginase
VIGVPMDLGANRRGVDMGPSAIRVTNVAERLAKLGWDVVDMGDVDVPIPEVIQVGDRNRKFAEGIRKVCDDLSSWVRKALQEGRVPIVLGGDHSIAMGSISGVSDFLAPQARKVGVIWMDAHGDMNTPWSTQSGNVHGMPLSFVLGMWGHGSDAGGAAKIAAGSSCLVGVRDIDERERKLILESGIRVFTMKEVDKHGIFKVMEDAIKVASTGTAGVHVSFDIDVVDPQVAPGVGTPKRGGLNYREAHLSMEMVADTGLLLSMDMVEVNPIVDDKNSTAELASELILSAMGKRIF